MKKLKAGIFIWASPLFCKDPEKSTYEYSLLNSKFQKRKIFYSIIFFSRSFCSGLKKIMKGKIYGCKILNNGTANNNPKKNIIYSPASFINLKDKTCKYFPSAKEDTEFIIIDNEIELSKDFLKVSFKLFLFLLPEFRRFNKNNNFLKRTLNWILLLSYFLSLEALNHYYLAVYIYDLTINYPNAKHICLHEMHPYSRVVYGVTSITKSNSITLQHALIHPTRLLFDLRNIKVKPYLPKIIFVWSEESKKVLNEFGWPESKIQFCSAERFLKYKKLKMNSNSKVSPLLLSDINKLSREKSLLFIPSLLKDDFKLSVKSALLARSIYKDLKIIIKLHPSFNLSIFDRIITFYLSLKSIKFTNLSLNQLFKSKPLTFTYSSTAVFEAALYKCPSFFMPSSLKYNGNELLLENIFQNIVEQYKKGIILEQTSNPLYISADRSKSFFGLERDNFFLLFD